MEVDLDDAFAGLPTVGDSLMGFDEGADSRLLPDDEKEEEEEASGPGDAEHDEGQEAADPLMPEGEPEAGVEDETSLPPWMHRAHASIIEARTPSTAMLGLDERLVAALGRLGVHQCFPVQAAVVPVVLAAHAARRAADVCVCAPTGSGKTLAYALPIVQALLPRVVTRLRALVLLPTRGLAAQLLFSATLTRSPAKLAPLQLVNPRYFCVAGARYATPATLKEWMLTCGAQEKPRLLLLLLRGLLEAEAQEAEAEDVAEGGRAEGESGQTRVLIASDAMARGMDVEGVSVVINYDPPANIKGYVHRVGRTARAGKAGTSYTLLKDSEVHHFKASMAKAAKAYRPLELPAQRPALARLSAEYERALVGVRWALSEEREGRLPLSAPMEEVEDAYFAHRQTRGQEGAWDGASEGQQQQLPNMEAFSSRTTTEPVTARADDVKLGPKMANAPKYGKRPRGTEEPSALVQDRRLRLAAALLEDGL
eukprot:jgi/Chrpa1/7213/Chrysochromulina_OHIO_Genome00016614-RA